MKLLVGYHGKGNFGDDIILDEYVQHSSEKYIVFAYGDIVKSKNILSVLLWSQYRLINAIKFVMVLPFVSEVVWVGGTCFSDQDGVGGYRFMNLALSLGKKVSYEFIGVNKLVNDNNILQARKLLSRAYKLTVRDRHSIENIRSILHDKKDIQLVRDLGEQWLERKYNEDRGEESGELLLIAWRNLEKYESNQLELIDRLIAYIKRNYPGSKIVIINTDETSDILVSPLIYERLLDTNESNTVNYLPNLSVNEKLNLIKNSSEVITSRLHIAIAGKIFKKKTLAYLYSDKMYYFQEVYGYESLKLNSDVR